MDFERLTYFDEDFDRISDILSDHFNTSGLMEGPLFYVMSKVIGNTYEPGTQIAAASVGCGNFINDDVLIKGLHILMFGDTRDVKVVGMDLQEKIIPSKDHDVEFRGVSGNAAIDYAWQKGLHDCPIEVESYDFIQFLNPDFCNSKDWIHVYRTALQYLSSTGVLVTVAHSSDENGLREIISKLEEDNKKFKIDKIRGFEIGASEYGNPQYVATTIQHKLD